MVPYFPEIYPGELLYSVLARYHRHMGAQTEQQTLVELFGDPHAVASAGLPGNLAILSQNLPPERQLTAERLAREHTLYPYYVAHQPPSVAEIALREMSEGPSRYVRLRLGVAASTIPAPARLRYCPECFVHAVERIGEAWWRRDHQLPGVLVCCEHVRPLQESDVRPGVVPRNGYRAAAPETCSLDSEEPEWAGDSARLQLLREIALRSRALLEASAPFGSSGDLVRHYRQRLAQLDLVRGPRQVDQRKLTEAFNAIFAPLASVALVPGIGGKAQTEWLSQIACKHTKVFHALHHILFQIFLDILPARAIAVPLPVKVKRAGTPHSHASIEERRRRWSQLRHDRPDLSRKGLAELLTADHSWLLRHDREWLEANLPPPCRPDRHIARVDWLALDKSLVRQILRAAVEIVAIMPPVRITLAEIARHIGRPSFFRGQCGKLPRTLDVLNRLVEPLESFRLRRIAWAAAELRRAGIPPRPWRIRQKAHLRCSTPAIDMALRRHARDGVP